VVQCDHALKFHQCFSSSGLLISAGPQILVLFTVEQYYFTSNYSTSSNFHALVTTKWPSFNIAVLVLAYLSFAPFDDVAG
jgi:hypothetical protein